MKPHITELLLLASVFVFRLINADPITKIHQKGYCAMRGQCGSQGFVNLPCADNGPAAEPDTDTFRQLLTDTCGTDFATGPVCCEEDQLTDLVQQIKNAEPIISTCPACWSNFLQFWCTFTCSPDQSTFLNLTSLYQETMVNSVDFWVGDNFGNQFYDSCKDIKFGSSNGYAMEFIGGGAKNWHEMVTFMGTKRPFMGSPIQIDFPPVEDGNALVRYDADGKPCNSSESAYRCACVDCEATCPILEPAPAEQPECYVGLLRCWSFAMLMTYSLIVIGTITVLFTQNHRFGRWLNAHFGIRLERDPARGLYERVALADDDEHDETLLDPDHIPRRYWLNSRLQSWFYLQGLFCARNPWTVITLGLVLVTLCSLGWSRFAVERDPVHLWVSPSSQALQEKNHFDSHFSPFYRATQLFFVSPQPIASAETLEHLFHLENEIREMKSSENNYTLKDVCFHPNGDACVVQSVTGYWQGDLDMFDPDTWQETLQGCVSEPVDCLPEYQQPLKPEMILGGYEDDRYLEARAFVVTFVLKNSLDQTQALKAEEWEKSLVDKILSTLNERPEWKDIRISYSTESSLETELNKSSNTDALTIIISYLVMFLYASLALGRFHSWNPRRLIVDSKFGLGICGILIVIFSVSAAVGLFSLTGKKTTLIIAEVIPFLVLAVGVDNIFILCHEFARREELAEDESLEERIAKTLGKMGPSILLSSLSETIAFGLGTLVTMPAVSSFAIVAAIAIFVDFVLQVTCFVACMALDARRTKADRVDCFPCVRVRAPEAVVEEGWLQKLFRVHYVPVLLGQKMRYFVCLVFLGMFMFGLTLVPQLPLGLDQRIALPSDSYLVSYFNDLDQYFNVGPPVYFVLREANLTDNDIRKKVCGRFPGCEERSLATVLEQERKRSNVSYIAQPASVWIDDYLHWLNPRVGCCRFKKQDSMSAWSPVSLDQKQYRLQRELCDPEDDDDECEYCDPDWSVDIDTLPQGREFLDLFNFWIQMPPDMDCPLGGKAAYGDAIQVDYARTTINASHFRTFHTPLRTQSDFIAAQASARRIAHELSRDLNLDIYPYSVFYIFFEQYSYIVSMALELLGFAILSIFIITSALLGSLWSGATVMGVVIMILVDVVGAMTLWGVSLNAVSLVNLVICVGISVEFCCHIARGFMVAGGNRKERAGKSLSEVGSSVFSGITLTKFTGIFVLAFTRSKIFEVYYFRMYLAIVVFGALHGLVLLPVLLCMFGGEGMSLLADFDEDGFSWPSHNGWGRNSRRMLASDNDSFDQVLITDVTGSNGDRQVPTARKATPQNGNVQNSLSVDDGDLR